jgi:hypothetical protein
MVMPQSWSKNLSVVQNQRGSITAELVMAMPAVALIISLTLGAFALQIERMKMVGVAATAARAIARGEDSDLVAGMVAELLGVSSTTNLDIVFREEFACAILTRAFEIPGLETEILELSETHCARKLGL